MHTAQMKKEYAEKSQEQILRKKQLQEKIEADCRRIQQPPELKNEKLDEKRLRDYLIEEDRI